MHSADKDRKFWRHRQGIGTKRRNSICVRHSQAERHATEEQTHPSSKALDTKQQSSRCQAAKCPAPRGIVPDAKEDRKMFVDEYLFTVGERIYADGEHTFTVGVQTMIFSYFRNAGGRSAHRFQQCLRTHSRPPLCECKDNAFISFLQAFAHLPAFFGDDYPQSYHLQDRNAVPATIERRRLQRLGGTLADNPFLSRQPKPRTLAQALTGGGSDRWLRACAYS